MGILEEQKPAPYPSTPPNFGGNQRRDSVSDASPTPRQARYYQQQINQASPIGSLAPAASLQGPFYTGPRQIRNPFSTSRSHSRGSSVNRQQRGGTRRGDGGHSPTGSATDIGSPSDPKLGPFPDTPIATTALQSPKLLREKVTITFSTAELRKSAGKELE